MSRSSCANQFLFESSYTSFNCSSNITEYFTFDDDEINSQLNILYVVLELLVAIFAVIGNALVILVFCRERKIRKRTNFYILSLALADFLVGLMGIPFAILISIGYPKNCYFCLLEISALLSFCTISIFSLVLISLDRFVSILFPLKFTKLKKFVVAEIAGCWILGAIIGFLPFVWHINLPITKCFYTNVVSDGLQLFRFVFVVIIPMTVIVAFYLIIYSVALKQLRNERKSSCCLQTITDSKACIHLVTKREIKVTVNIFIIVLFFMICWLPLNVIKSIKILCTTCSTPDNLITIGIILTHFNSALNPFLYAYHLKEFRQAILRLLGFRRRENSVML